MLVNEVVIVILCLLFSLSRYFFFFFICDFLQLTIDIYDALFKQFVVPISTIRANVEQTAPTIQNRLMRSFILFRPQRLRRYRRCMSATNMSGVCDTTALFGPLRLTNDSSCVLNEMTFLHTQNVVGQKLCRTRWSRLLLCTLSSHRKHYVGMGIVFFIWNRCRSRITKKNVNKCSEIS